MREQVIDCFIIIVRSFGQPVVDRLLLCFGNFALREFYEQQYDFDLDFADVRGQESVKRALEVAAAGGHNIIKISPIIRQQQMLDKQFFMLYFIIQNPFLLQKQAA